MLPDATISARLLLTVLRLAEERGVRGDDLLKAVGLDREAIEDEDGRVPFRVERAFWREAAERTGDPLLGLRVSQRGEPGGLGLYQLLCKTASTFRETLLVGKHYLPLIHGGAVISLEEDGDVARVSSNIGKDDYDGPEATDYYAAALITMGRACTGRLPRILRVRVAHSAPPGNAQVEALARYAGKGAVVEFDAEATGIELDLAVLDWRLPGAAPRLHRILRGHADLLMGELPEQSPFLLRVRRNLLEELEQGRATLAGLAARLGMDPRSLQRRLAAHGCSFGEILESLRKEVVVHYLRDEELGLSEVAFRLGFSSQQSFHRAFRAWNGISPGRWRREQLDPRERAVPTVGAAPRK